MKKAIDKAMGNELDIIACAAGESPEDISDESHVCIPKADEEEYHVINIYELIFKVKLGFIDKLVGEYKGCQNKRCNARHTKRERKHIVIEHCQAGFRRPGEQCNEFEGARPAGHHRSKLANMTLDEMKVYIRKLAQEGI